MGVEENCVKNRYWLAVPSIENDFDSLVDRKNLSSFWQMILIKKIA